ncbi:MAG TPA: murein biosynthesis integral membrane protein MurJ [Chloroflexaceae bacterium]|nr:murein biosynthesis integral membrane protein MurJ [Chloroflexaceae bacterium]
MQLSSLLRRARAGALGSSLVVMGGFVLSRVTGLLRDVVATYFFGTSPEAAAYRSAFTIVDLLYLVIIGGALGSSFIPVFIEVWERDGRERAWRVASAIVTWALIALGAASALVFLAAPWLVRALYGGEGFDEATLTLATRLTRLFLLSPLLLGMGGLAMAALNARDHFALPALAPSIYNLGIIGGALLAPWVGIWGMAWGVVVGALLYLLVQLPALRRIGMELRPRLGRGVEEVGRVARQMGPRVLGQTAAHASFVITLALAARLEDGAAKVAGLAYAYGLMMLPYGVFSLSLSQVAFPRLARLVAEGRRVELAADVRRTLGTILWLTLPAAAALLALGFPAARALYQRGAFDALSLQYTVSALFGYALALPAFAASEILIRSFYAMQRTWTPVLVGLLQVGLNLGLGAALLRAGGDVAALALAFSVANNAEALLLLLLLARALPGIWRDGALWRTVAAALGGAALLGLGLTALSAASRGLVPALAAGHAYAWTSELPGLLAWLAAAGLAGGAGYLGLTALLGAAPARAALARLRRG